MSDSQPFRQILTTARRISNVNPDAQSTLDSISAVRRAIEESPRSLNKRIGLIALSSGLAALIAVAIVIIGLTTSPRITAAQELQHAADVTRAYQGWVHIKP